MLLLSPSSLSAPLAFLHLSYSPLFSPVPHFLSNFLSYHRSKFLLFLFLLVFFSLSPIFPSSLLRLFCDPQLQCYFSDLGFSPLWVLFPSPLVVRSRFEENIFSLILGSVLHHSMVWILAESRLNRKYFFRSVFWSIKGQVWYLNLSWYILTSIKFYYDHMKTIKIQYNDLGDILHMTDILKIYSVTYL